MKIPKYDLLKNGLYIQAMTPTEKLISLIEKLRPLRTNLELVRIGSIHDGGYLIPNDLEGIIACFSPGVGLTSDFETDLQVKFNIPSHLCDYSVEILPNDFKPASFERKFMGPIDDERFTTINSWMDRNLDQSAEGDLILQMDIEGGEYTALLSIDEQRLQRFRIIVVEFHSVEHWSDPAFFEMAQAVFQKLLKFFHVTHAHPNNFGRLIQLGPVIVPEVFELTLVRKDRCEPMGFYEGYPHELDSPCNPYHPDLALPHMWQKPPAQEQLGNSGIFNRIYKNKMWANDQDSMSSGPGSHKQRIIQPYIAAVQKLIQELDSKIIVDLGCGDLNVGQYLFSLCDHYIACDVSDLILHQNKNVYRDPKIEFRQLDIAKDQLPCGDIAFVRQVLQHLNNADISAFVESINKSRCYNHLVVTEHVPKGTFVANLDIKTGHGIRLFSRSGVELDQPPFHLNYKQKDILLEIDEPIHGIPALIRTSLFHLI